METRGGKVWVMYMTDLIRRMNIDRTEMTTLKFVILSHSYVNCLLQEVLIRIVKKCSNVQLTPDHRHSQRPIVRGSIKHLVRIRIPAMLGAFIPEYSSIGVWTGDAEESESSDGKREFKTEEGDEKFGRFPMARDEHCVGSGQNVCQRGDG